MTGRRNSLCMLLTRRKCELLLKFFTQFFLLSQGSLNAQVAFVELTKLVSVTRLDEGYRCLLLHPRHDSKTHRRKHQGTVHVGKQNSGSFCEPKIHSQYSSTNFTLTSICRAQSTPHQHVPTTSAGRDAGGFCFIEFPPSPFSHTGTLDPSPGARFLPDFCWLHVQLFSDESVKVEDIQDPHPEMDHRPVVKRVQLLVQGHWKVNREHCLDHPAQWRRVKESTPWKSTVEVGTDLSKVEQSSCMGRSGRMGNRRTRWFHLLEATYYARDLTDNKDHIETCRTRCLQLEPSDPSG